MTSPWQTTMSDCSWDIQNIQESLIKGREISMRPRYVKDSKADKTWWIRGTGEWDTRCSEWGWCALLCAPVSQIAWDDEQKIAVSGTLVAGERARKAAYVARISLMGLLNWGTSICSVFLEIRNLTKLRGQRLSKCGCFLGLLRYAVSKFGGPLQSKRE